ncbi:glycosyltransferase family protein [Gryllotalpicola protaetiae]|uniref:Glycosyltransferase n=1 Tax=Gryllotalpicola protaetiae TaxID=2419771 RepID=A0A387BTA4_9MICO|nr:glycosyltransferase [Gryllotalpicola protaetiae]AYG04279.1 glycosyltransferase [Gryllotalpicola protaetiae]
MLRELRTRVVGSLRVRLSADSLTGAYARVAYRVARQTRDYGRVARAEALSKRPQSVDRLYAEVLAGQLARRRSHEHVADLTRFVVVVESNGKAEDAARTGESIARQNDVFAVMIEQPGGTPLADSVAAAAEHDAHFVMFLAAGSELAEDALVEIARSHRVDPAAKLLTFDTDLFGHGADRLPGRFRPGWSPETLLGANYIGRAFAFELSRARTAVGEAKLNDRGIWRMLLGAGFADREVMHVGHVLLTEHSDPSVSLPTEADAQMVEDVLAERGERAAVELSGGILRARFQSETAATVQIVIPTRHSRRNLERLLPTLAATDYPAFTVTIFDNGEQSEENVRWYEESQFGVSLEITWWSETPFNYSRVNNVAAATSDSDVIVFLNDDTEIVDPTWLSELVGHLLRPGVGTVGFQHRRDDGTIQHGGVVIGPGGTADNIFNGLPDGSNTLIGPTLWYRDSLAVTAACVAVRRSDFDAAGGFDERFILCGSDVALGLDQVIAGRRNVVIPFDSVRHYESITRGSSVPYEDFFATYWRYAPWLRNGDPYWPAVLSRSSSTPRLAGHNEPVPVRQLQEALGRPHIVVKQNMGIAEEAVGLLGTASVSREAVEAIAAQHAGLVGRRAVQTINWYIPDIDMPFFGGLNTAFRIADKLRRDHGVRNRFIMLAAPNELYVRSALDAAFDGLGTASDIVFYTGHDDELAALPPADAGIATLWLTAAHLAKTPGVDRKFYLVQDYESAFYPASTMFAMTEQTYQLGLYGICNTASMHDTYTREFGGKAMFFSPAVDRSVYHADGRREKDPDEPVTIFVYARDHFRNCWELAGAALTEIKRRHGHRVRIIAAGARYLPPSTDFIDMGLLDYRATGALYRETDIGLTMQISRHPSYLPLELMASGVPMVAPDSHWFRWLFHDGEDSALSMMTLDDVVEQLDRLVTDVEFRRRLSAGALATIDRGHGDWDAALSGIYDYLSDPEQG